MDIFPRDCAVQTFAEFPDIFVNEMSVTKGKLAESWHLQRNFPSFSSPMLRSFISNLKFFPKTSKHLPVRLKCLIEFGLNNSCNSHPERPTEKWEKALTQIFILILTSDYLSDDLIMLRSSPKASTHLFAYLWNLLVTTKVRKEFRNSRNLRPGYSITEAEACSLMILEPLRAAGPQSTAIIEM